MNKPAEAENVRRLPPQANNRHNYRYRLAATALKDAPGRPMWSTGSDPKNIVVLHPHPGPCGRSAQRIREHAELNTEWTRRLQTVGFTVRPGRCGVVATCPLPPTRALVEPHGLAQDFTRKVTFTEYSVGGLLRLNPTYASADYAVLTPEGTLLRTVKQLDHGVQALAVYWGLPDEEVPVTYVARGQQGQPAVPQGPAAAPDLRPAAVTLLRTIAGLDTGAGVVFHAAPAGRWRLQGSTYAVNDRTFHPLESAGLLDVGDGDTDPVRITEAGRAWLDEHPEPAARRRPTATAAGN
ncbi:hypothetical protein [Streptomyces filamentosus]|uniref:hypothetical protein n=1 Tax=Streptomyces filamentosus TaxID=67294 RepID=UPI0033C9BA7E